MANGVTGSEAQTRATAVSLADVTITFRLADGGSYTAVQGASLDVADGEFVAIVGPTGCGKSTLLNVTAGLFPPSVGGAQIFGLRSAGPQPAGRIPVPVRRAVSLEDRARQRRDRSRDRGHAARGGEARARRNGSTAWGSAVSARATRTCCPADSGNASVLRRC